MTETTKNTSVPRAHGLRLNVDHARQCLTWDAAWQKRVELKAQGLAKAQAEGICWRYRIRRCDICKRFRVARERRKGPR